MIIGPGSDAGTQSLTSSGVKGSRGCLNLVGFAVTAVWTVVAVAVAVGAIVMKHGSIEGDRPLGLHLGRSLAFL